MAVHPDGVTWTERARPVDEPPVRTVGTVGAFENLEHLREQALLKAREWERYGYTDKADDWRTVAKWLEGIKR